MDIKPEETLEYWKTRALAAEKRWDLYFHTEDKQKKELATQQKVKLIITWVNDFDLFTAKRNDRVWAAMLWYSKVNASRFAMEMAHGMGMLLKDFERLTREIHNKNIDPSILDQAEKDLQYYEAD